MASKISVLITGASSGIGHSVALDLAAGGHQVFASVRKIEDADSLIKLQPSITPVIFDVTNEIGVMNSVAEIRRLINREQVFSIVNNAGVAVAGPLEEVSIAEIKRQFDVNVFGALSVIKSYLPLMREQKQGPEVGRIVNMSSVSGLLAAPFLGPYSASKYALEALSDTLRRELMAEGIKVLLVEPGPIQTPIWKKGFETDRKVLSARYEKPLARFEKSVRKSAAGALAPEFVAKAVRHALFATNPKTRQIVTSFAQRLQIEAARILPTDWIDRTIRDQLFRK
jgi:short-subunit dehydrogenase